MGGDRIHLLPSCNSLWLPNSPCAPSLQGANSLEEELETLEMPLAQAIVKGENEQEEEEEEELDMCLPQPTKKRRLTSRQLEFLEANFALENKLEPERKLRLAVEIGLQPRQVAIWFQNRRARFKNKQLEKDYDSLKDSFEKLKAEFECLVKEKKSFESEVSSLKGKLASREKGLLLETLEPLEYYYPQSTTPREETREGEKPCKLPVVTNTPKQEDASSAKSDVFDSDSPLSLLGPDHSDHFTQNEEEDHQLQHPFGSCFLSSSHLNTVLTHPLIPVTMASQWKTSPFGI